MAFVLRYNIRRCAVCQDIDRHPPLRKIYNSEDEVQEIKHWEKVVNRLLEIRDNYPKYLLAADNFAGGNYEGIKTMHIADFLLSKEF